MMWSIFITSWLHGIIVFLLPVSIGSFFDLFYHTDTNRGRLLSLLGIQITSLQQFFFFFSFAIFLKGITGYIEKCLTAAEADRFVQYVSKKLFTVQVKWPVEIFNQKPFGRYLLRYSSDMSSCRNLIARGFFGGIKYILLFTSGTLILFLLNSQLTWILLLSLGVTLPLTLWLSRQQKPVIKKHRDQKSLLLAYITETFNRHASIKETGEEEKVIDRFYKKQAKVFAASLAYNRWNSLLNSLSSLYGFIFVAVILWQVSLSKDLLMHAGDMLVYILVLFTMLPSLRRLFQLSGTWQKGNLSVKKISMLIQQKELSPLTDNNVS